MLSPKLEVLLPLLSSIFLPPWPSYILLPSRKIPASSLVCHQSSFLLGGHFSKPRSGSLVYFLSFSEASFQSLVSLIYSTSSGRFSLNCSCRPLAWPMKLVLFSLPSPRCFVLSCIGWSFRAFAFVSIIRALLSILFLRGGIPVIFCIFSMGVL